MPEVCGVDGAECGVTYLSLGDAFTLEQEGSIRLCVFCEIGWPVSEREASGGGFEKEASSRVSGSPGARRLHGFAV